MTLIETLMAFSIFISIIVLFLSCYNNELLRLTTTIILTIIMSFTLIIMEISVRVVI